MREYREGNEKKSGFYALLCFALILLTVNAIAHKIQLEGIHVLHHLRKEMCIPRKWLWSNKREFC